MITLSISILGVAFISLFPNAVRFLLSDKSSLWKETSMPRFMLFNDEQMRFTLSVRGRVYMLLIGILLAVHEHLYM